MICVFLFYLDFAAVFLRDGWICSNFGFLDCWRRFSCSLGGGAGVPLFDVHVLDNGAPFIIDLNLFRPLSLFSTGRFWILI